MVAKKFWKKIAIRREKTVRGNSSIASNSLSTWLGGGNLGC